EQRSARCIQSRRQARPHHALRDRRPRARPLRAATPARGHQAYAGADHAQQAALGRAGPGHPQTQQRGIAPHRRGSEARPGLSAAQLADREPARGGADRLRRMKLPAHTLLSRLCAVVPAKAGTHTPCTGKVFAFGIRLLCRLERRGMNRATWGLLLALAALGAAGGPAFAQADWPSRPIRLIVPFTPGSSSDIVARVVAQKLGERLKQQIFVENRVGASGNLGTEAVARAEPDGYTMGLANASTHAVAPSLSSRLAYNPVRDFAPVSMLGSSPFVLSVYPGLPAKNVAELIGLAKAKPRTLTYASAGPATLSHLSGALFEKMAHIEMIHVPYRGTSQAALDLMEGRVDMQFGTIPPSI